MLDNNKISNFFDKNTFRILTGFDTIKVDVNEKVIAENKFFFKNKEKDSLLISSLGNAKFADIIAYQILDINTNRVK